MADYYYYIGGKFPSSISAIQMPTEQIATAEITNEFLVFSTHLHPGFPVSVNVCKGMYSF